MVGSQSCLIPFVHLFQFNGNIGSVLASGERSDLPYYLSAADGSACEIAGVSARWRYASCRAAFSRALFFFECLRWRQASCRTCFQPGAGASRTRVCLLGRLLQCGFPVRPISAVATSILPHLGKQFFSAVASSNLPRSMSYTKNKQCASRSLACLRACVRVCVCVCMLRHPNS